MYVIHDDAGTILATIAGVSENYGRNTLDKNNQKWIFLTSTSSVNPMTSYVDVETKELKQCQPMQIALDKSSVKADGVDTVTITGIPLHSSVSIFYNNTLQSQQTMIDDKLEIASDQPAEFVIKATCSHYLPFELTIEAVSP